MPGCGGLGQVAHDIVIAALTVSDRTPPEQRKQQRRRARTGNVSIWRSCSPCQHPLSPPTQSTWRCTSLKCCCKWSRLRNDFAWLQWSHEWFVPEPWAAARCLANVDCRTYVLVQSAHMYARCRDSFAWLSSMNALGKLLGHSGHFHLPPLDPSPRS